MPKILVFVLTLAFVIEVNANQCAKVDCDCLALPGGPWQTACIEQQRLVEQGCKDNAGRAKMYCGIHGPAAFPTAISLNSINIEAGLEALDVAELNKQIKTQQWSLLESFESVKKSESAQRYGDAIQLLSLYERDIDRLYQLQKRKLVILNASGQTQKAAAQAKEQVTGLLDYAQSMKTYSKTLWSKRLSAAAEDRMASKAFRVMAMKLARMTASIYEQAGDQLGLTEQDEAAARAWQNAATMAQDLLAMEATTENKSRHIEFYQAQASARFHRATYYWLRSGEHPQQVEKSLRLAGTYADSPARVPSEALAHEADVHDISAMIGPGN